MYTECPIIIVIAVRCNGNVASVKNMSQSFNDLYCAETTQNKLYY